MPPESSEAYRPAEPLRYPPLDARSAMHVVFDAGGQRRIEYGDLLQRTHRWPTTDTAPEAVNALLATSRHTYAMAMFHYDLFVVASVWSLMAVEAALRHHCSSIKRTTLAALIRRAGDDGLFDETWVERLDAGRQLRNDLVHVQCPTTFNPAISGIVVEASHEAVAVLYPREQEV